MWSKIKTVFSYIGAFAIGIFTCLLGVLVSGQCNRSKTDGVGTDTEGAGRTNREAEDTRRKLEETTEVLESTNRRFGEVLQEVRASKQDFGDSNPYS